MNIQIIVENYLKRNRYDGLVNLDIECTCQRPHVMSCEGPLDTCQPAYIKKNGDMCPGKKPGREG